MSVDFNILYASAVNKSTRYRLDTLSILKLLFNCFQYVKLAVRCLLANLWQLQLSLLSIIDAFAIFLFKIFFLHQVHIPSALAYRTRVAISVKSVSFLFMAHHTFFYTEIGWHTDMHTHAHTVPNLKSSTRRTNMKTFSATKRIFLSWCEAILCIFHIALILHLASLISLTLSISSLCAAQHSLKLHQMHENAATPWRSLNPASGIQRILTSCAQHAAPMHKLLK